MSSLFYDAVGTSDYRPIASDLEGNTSGTTTVVGGGGGRAVFKHAFYTEY